MRFYRVKYRTQIQLIITKWQKTGLNHETEENILHNHTFISTWSEYIKLIYFLDFFKYFQNIGPTSKQRNRQKWRTWRWPQKVKDHSRHICSPPAHGIYNHGMVPNYGYHRHSFEFLQHKPRITFSCFTHKFCKYSKLIFHKLPFIHNLTIILTVT